ncbi:MAG: LptF/LptG family permease, partial [Bacteroidales bacterium]|nr:LptF/LptG family permease [Bacteroidales bacterium]
TLFNGTNYEETNTKLKKDTTLALQKVDFTMQEVVIPLSNYAFKKSDGSKFSNEVMTKGLSQLKIDRDSLERQKNKQLDNLTKRATYTEHMSNMSQVLISKTEPEKYKGNINIDSLFTWKDLEQEREAYRTAAEKVDQQITQVQYFPVELNQVSYPLRRTIQESFRKFTLSIACLIFFFIGAPLGAIIRKGGLGTPVIISMLFFVVYWVVDISGKKLANDGAITPFLGAFISTFVLMPIGAFLTWQSTKDSALFNADAYVSFFKNLFSKARWSAIAKLFRHRFARK